MSATPARQKLMKQIKVRLGGGIVDNELDPDHFEYAIDVAIDRYRMRSNNAMEESFLFMQLQPEIATYTLPDEVQEVREIYRRTMGGGNGTGAMIDPFALAYTNNMYMLSSPGGSGAMGTAGGAGQLALYDFAAQYQETAGRLFGRDVQFSWNAATKKLVLHRRFTGQEEVALHVYNTKPEEVLFADPYAKVWLRDYSIAQCKLIMGEARSKFASYAGPQGGVTLNGDALKQEALAEIERLEKELETQVDAHEGFGFVIG